eukprot:3285815-Pyramimonas_sp.AAC.1
MRGGSGPCRAKVRGPSFGAAQQTGVYANGSQPERRILQDPAYPGAHCLLLGCRILQERATSE